MGEFIVYLKEFLLRYVVRCMLTGEKEECKMKNLEQNQSSKDLVLMVEKFLKSEYDFRFNLLTEAVEFRKKSTPRRNFRLIGTRELNSLCIAARKSGLDCWDRDISRYIHSEEVASYHPFQLYMDELPAWDGTDRLTPLAAKVSGEPVWISGFRRWMLGLAAQWLGMDSLHANSVAPVLISSRQGMHKSTFCKMLIPPSLQAYYTDSFDLNATSSAEQKLTAFGLINLDEMDKFSASKMTWLKNLMQMAGLNIRKAYKKNFASLPRIASFIATSNQKEILTDPTGSRRFLCVDVKEKIDTSPIDYEQLYAQLKAMLEAGERYWFTTEEETELMAHNHPFHKQGIIEGLFYRYYRVPGTEENAELFQLSDIYEHLKKKHPSLMRTSSPITFGRTLTALNIERVRRKNGNYYKLIQTAG